MYTRKDLFGMDCFVVIKSVLLPFDAHHGVHHDVVVVLINFIGKIRTGTYNTVYVRMHCFYRRRITEGLFLGQEMGMRMYSNLCDPVPQVECVRVVIRRGAQIQGCLAGQSGQKSSCPRPLSGKSRLFQQRPSAKVTGTAEDRIIEGETIRRTFPDPSSGQLRRFK